MKAFPINISNIPNPTGLDKEIGTIQSYFSQLGFIEKIFGIANIQRRTKSEYESLTSKREGLSGDRKADTYYPQGSSYGTNGGRIDVDLTFDDTYASRLFFLNCGKGDINTKGDGWDWTDGVIQISQKCSAIFHCNLDSIEQPSSDYVKNYLLSALQKCPKVIASQIFEGTEDAWKEFTITPEMTGITRYPNYCLRIDFTVTYLPFDYNI